MPKFQQWERRDLNFRKTIDMISLSPTTWPPAKYHTNLDYSPTIKSVFYAML